MIDILMMVPEWAGVRRHTIAAAPDTTTDPFPWVDAALCKEHDPEIWFPEQGGKYASAEAKAICADCPVRAECLALAMTAEIHRYRAGIWGGLAPTERRALAKTGWQPADPLPAVRTIRKAA